MDADLLLLLNRQALLGQFVSGFAHDLNNPLQIISGLVELLRDRQDLPPDALTKIVKIGAQAERATLTVRELVGFARERSQTLSRLDFSRLVEQAIALRRFALGRKGIAPTFEAIGDRPFTVHGVPQHLEEMVLSLLVNAESAMAGQKGDTQAQLRVRLSRTGAMIRLDVQDNGPGVAEAVRQHLFDPFVTTKSGESAGLGLAAAAVIASLHGGRLTLEPDGPGARFVVELPAG